jgi:hypothetical protein
VIALGIARAPEFVQVTRQATGRVDNHVTRLQFGVQNSYDFALERDLTRPRETLIKSSLSTGSIDKVVPA